MKSYRLSVVATLAVGALTLTACAAQDEKPDAQPSDAAGAVTEAGEAAAAWMLAQRDDSGLLVATTSFEGETSTMADIGGSIDLAIGLHAIGHPADDVSALVDAVATNLESYVGAGAEVYAGPSAKALTLAATVGRDTATFGGIDLVTRVEDTVSTTGPTAGRIADASEYGDYANTLGQVYAAAGLSLAGSGLADSAVDFLLDQQCEAGFFRLELSATDAKQQDCDSADVPADQAPDVTAIVAQQLAAIADTEAGSDEDVTEALTDARAWLISQQAEDGSFADPDNGVNANSTGLAGWALRDLGAVDEAERAAQWLIDVQVPSGESGELADEVGAIAYDAAALETGRDLGIADPLDRTQWVRVGAQAFPALAAGAAETK